MNEPPTAEAVPVRRLNAPRTPLDAFGAYAMAPKRTQDAYVQKDASLPDARPNDFREIALFLANCHGLAHNSGGLRRASG